MTTGCLLFAQNTSSIDYVKMAVFAAKRVRQYLDIPVTLITNNKTRIIYPSIDKDFDSVIEIPPARLTQQRVFYDGSLYSKTAEWSNFSRSQVYSLTPYDQTMVMDTDYILNSSILKPAFNNDHDFQIYRQCFDLSLDREPDAFKRINDYSIPFYWATVFIFRKSVTMECFFDLIEYIKNNWMYFRTLYSIAAPTFRNDFAFSIAIHIMNGKTNGEFAVDLPGKMIFASDKDVLVNTDGDKMKFLVEKKNRLGEYNLVKTTGLDVHVMNKFSLNRFIDGGIGV
jgi:hypothetical protein